MTTSDLIKILCQMSPDTEVLISLDGFPPMNVTQATRVYDHGRTEEGVKRVVISTDRDNYKKP